jgi:hypothetical protein
MVCWMNGWVWQTGHWTAGEDSWEDLNFVGSLQPTKDIIEVGAGGCSESEGDLTGQQIHQYCIYFYGLQSWQQTSLQSHHRFAGCKLLKKKVILSSFPAMDCDYPWHCCMLLCIIVIFFKFNVMA